MRQRGDPWDLAPLFDALPLRLKTRRHSWQALVGQPLAGETALVDVTAGGVLRVIAANDAARREVLAREKHVLAAFNQVATHLGARPATTLVCWVRAGFRRVHGPEAGRVPPVRPAALDADAVSRAQADLAPLRDRALADRLAELRARMLSNPAPPGLEDKGHGA